MCRQLAIFVLLGLRGIGPHEERHVVAVDVVGVFHPISVQIIDRAFSQANGQNAAAVLIRMNTAGGMPDVARQIVGKILASPVPVVTYVTPSTAGAASGRSGWRARENNRYGAANTVCATHFQTFWRLICKAC